MSDRVLEVEWKVRVNQQRIEDMLTGAFEGGSNYWCSKVEPVFKEEFKNSSADYLSEAIGRGDISEIRVYDEEEDQPHIVKCDKEHLQRALQIMATFYDTHFRDMMEENGDAITDDVFFQCLVFGEVIYG